MTVPRKTVLLSAFDPFGGRGTNSSERLLMLADRSWIEDSLEINLERRILPVEWAHSESTLEKLLTDLNPSVVFCLGEAVCENLRLETVAKNWGEGRIGDNSGYVRPGSPLSTSAPSFLSAKNYEEIFKKHFAQRELALDLSVDAGTFLCNNVFFRLLEYQSKAPRVTSAGFLHVPVDWELRWGTHAECKRVSTQVLAALLSAGLEDFSTC